MVTVGIIGGSGLDNPQLLEKRKDVRVNTPFGRPSAALVSGSIGRANVVILARHGRTHEFSPSQVNYRANIWALKEAGCTQVIATTAAGSLQERIRPGDLVLVDQFIDRTTQRKASFFGRGKVVHIPMADPFCPVLRQALHKEAQAQKLRCHPKGTVVTIEGPRFSTRAESQLFRSWKADVINMSTVPEVVLAREAGMCYGAVAMATDYDCWRDSTVDIQIVLRTMKENAEKVTRLILGVIPRLTDSPCACREAVKAAGI